MISSTGEVFVPAERSPVMGTAVKTQFNLVTTLLDESTSAVKSTTRRAKFSNRSCWI